MTRKTTCVVLGVLAAAWVAMIVPAASGANGNGLEADLLLIASPDPPDQRPKDISEADWIKRKHEMWAKVRLDAQKRVTAAGAKAVKPLFDLIAKTQDESVKITALTALSEMKAGDLADAGKPLMELLASKNPGVRYLAAKILGLMQYKPAVPALNKLTEEEESIVRMIASDALGQIGDRSSVPVLLSRVSDEQEKKTVRLHAINALGHLGFVLDVMPKLMGLLRSEDLTERNAAVEAIKVLVAVDLTSDGRWLIAHDAEKREVVIKELEAWWAKTLKDQPFRVAGGDAELTLRVNMMLQTWQAVPVRVRAVEAIRRLNDKRAVDYLIIAMSEKDAGLRKEVTATATGLSGIKIGPVVGETEAQWLDRVDDFRRRWNDIKSK